METLIGQARITVGSYLNLCVFCYVQKTRKILAEKIAQLNSAIDDVSAQLHGDDAPNGAAVASDEVEASI